MAADFNPYAALAQVYAKQNNERNRQALINNGLLYDSPTSFDPVTASTSNPAFNAAANAANTPTNARGQTIQFDNPTAYSPQQQPAQMSSSINTTANKADTKARASQTAEQKAAIQSKTAPSSEAAPKFEMTRPVPIQTGQDSVIPNVDIGTLLPSLVVASVLGGGGIFGQQQQQSQGFNLGSLFSRGQAGNNASTKQARSVQSENNNSMDLSAITSPVQDPSNAMLQAVLQQLAANMQPQQQQQHNTNTYFGFNP